MKSDKDIWKESLDKEENENLFKTKSGGKNTTPLTNKKIFKSKTEQTLEKRLITLEKKVKYLTRVVNMIKPETDRWENI